MAHTLDDIWQVINKMCNRITALETKYDSHIEELKKEREAENAEIQSAREVRANRIAFCSVTIAAITFFAAMSGFI